MRPPKSVKVGYATYTLEACSARESLAEERHGDCCSDLLRIRYNQELAPQQTAETLLHEIMHAVYEVWHISDDDKEEAKDREEWIVSRMATGIATVMRDNPKLFQWLEAALG